MNANFIEIRKRMLQYMSLKYGVIRTEIMLNMLFESGADSRDACNISLSELLMTTALEATATTPQSARMAFALVLKFFDSASADMAEITAIVPMQINSYLQVKGKKMIIPVSFEIGESEIKLFARTNATTMEYANAIQFDINAELSQFAISAAIRTVESENILSELNSVMQAQIVLVQRDAHIVKAEIENTVDFGVTVNPPNALDISVKRSLGVQIQAVMYCVKIAYLIDYRTRTLGEMGGQTLSSLEYITL